MCLFVLVVIIILIQSSEDCQFAIHISGRLIKNGPLRKFATVQSVVKLKNAFERGSKVKSNEVSLL